jgi:hypothetical protein
MDTNERPLIRVYSRSFVVQNKTSPPTPSVDTIRAKLTTVGTRNRERILMDTNKRPLIRVYSRSFVVQNKTPPPTPSVDTIRANSPQREPRKTANGH